MVAGEEVSANLPVRNAEYPLSVEDRERLAQASTVSCNMRATAHLAATHSISASLDFVLHCASPEAILILAKQSQGAVHTREQTRRLDAGKHSEMRARFVKDAAALVKKGIKISSSIACELRSRAFSTVSCCSPESSGRTASWKWRLSDATSCARHTARARTTVRRRCACVRACTCTRACACVRACVCVRACARARACMCVRACARLPALALA
eukprot:6184596-Pleurochrysis_carterae.AAC.1